MPLGLPTTSLSGKLHTLRYTGAAADSDGPDPSPSSSAAAGCSRRRSSQTAFCLFGFKLSSCSCLLADFQICSFQRASFPSSPRSSQVTYLGGKAGHGRDRTRPLPARRPHCGHCRGAVNTLATLPAYCLPHLLSPATFQSCPALPRSIPRKFRF